MSSHRAQGGQNQLEFAKLKCFLYLCVCVGVCETKESNRIQKITNSAGDNISPAYFQTTNDRATPSHPTVVQTDSFCMEHRFVSKSGSSVAKLCWMHAVDIYTNWSCATLGRWNRLK